MTDRGQRRSPRSDTAMDGQLARRLSAHDRPTLLGSRIVVEAGLGQTSYRQCAALLDQDTNVLNHGMARKTMLMTSL